ncbi:hypothetical protein P4594_23285 [Priestia megaterium]|uniref:hypothetical protein n=1 Tax=Priestia megaterium TaxID=1404 RepID=UPI002E23761A|nr:hypothetical protein [Priestia megaterium]
MHIITSHSKYNKLSQISGVSLDDKQNFHVWRLNSNGSLSHLNEVNKITRIKKYTKMKTMVTDIGTVIESERLALLMNAHSNEFFNPFFLRVDYSYYPLLKLIKEYLGEEYILNKFNNQVFESEGDFLQAIGEMQLNIY